MAGAQYDWPGGTTGTGTATPTPPAPWAQPIPTLFNLVNRWYYDPDRALIGRLETYWTGAGAKRKQKYRLVSESGKRIPIVKGYRLLDPQSRQLYTVADRYDTGGGARDFRMMVGTVSEADLARFFPEPGGGGVSPDTGANIAARAAEQAAQRAFDAEQSRLAREAAAELQRLQEENAMKRARLGEAGSLARTAAEVQQRARQLIAELTGVDPIRGAIAGQGGVQQGRTPAQGFNTQLQGIANAPIPQVNENMNIPQIEQTIGALQGQQQLPVAPSLGFARGGTIDMHQGDDGSFSARSKYADGAPDDENSGGDYGFSADQPSTKRAILTGERNFDGDEEVVVMDAARPGSVEIIPLVAGAQAGGTFDPSTIFQSLAPIYKKFGFGGVPTKMPTGQGYAFSPGDVGGQQVGGSRILSSLGYNPRLIRNVQTGATYFKNPQGQLQWISPDIWNQAKFNINDVLNVAPSELAEFGPLGSNLVGVPNISESPYKQYPQRSVSYAIPQPGGYDIPLPDPRQLAGLWRFLDQDTRNVLISAYGVGGMGTTGQAQTGIEEAVRFFTPTGTQTRAGSARFG